MQFIPKTIILLLILSWFTSCSKEKGKSQLYVRPGYEFPYDISMPDKTWSLPLSLREISGLSYIDDHRLACIQDEKGIIFIYNIKDGRIDNKINFGENGDYEGIEIVGNDAWILKSDGKLYDVINFKENSKIQVNKYSTALTGKNNTEGLAYDPYGERLLIACKERPFIKERRAKNVKAIYSFSLLTNQLDSVPLMLIDLDTVYNYKNYNSVTRLEEEIEEFLDPDNGDEIFQPSGIAVHPLTGEIYVMGSVGKLLLVYSKTGDLLAIINLDPQLLPQPEGICFSPGGLLYISSEGKGGSGLIREFGSTSHGHQ